MTTVNSAFWRHKQLEDLTPSEWELLCDGCGKCCLYKLEDIDSGELLHTSVACYLLDQQTCRCSQYHKRQQLVSDCIKLDIHNVRSISWLPSTCAYRLVAEGKDLPMWHPLVCGNTEAIHEAGVSVRSWAISEREVGDLEDYVIAWMP